MSYSAQPTDDAGYADGELSALAHEDSGDLITRVMVNTGLSMGAAADLIAEIQEATPARLDIKTTEIVQMMKRGLGIVIKSNNLSEVVTKLWCFVFAIGWLDLIGGINSVTDLGKKLLLTKQDVCKFVALFRDVIPTGWKTLPASGGQRGDAARAKFAGVRVAQENMRRRVRGFVKEQENK